MHSPQILALTKTGRPIQWIDVEAAIVYHAKDMVKWSLGDSSITLHGGTNRVTGNQSQLTTASIIAIDGDFKKQRKFNVTRQLVFRRDLHVCAFCGQSFLDRDLSVDHINPKYHGGQDSWMNLVTACKPCNHRKANRTPEEARMPLLYVPYEPNVNEAFILSNRRILADQMDFLINSGISKHSRIREYAASFN